MNKLKIGLFFGGRSAEHEVSIITALQACQNLDKDRYEIIPIYVSKEGLFFTNPKFLDLKNFKDVSGLLLSSDKITIGIKNGIKGFFAQGLLPKFTPLDLAFPMFHGSFGEDGCIQGLFEVYQIPYTGLGVMGSAVAMDKVLSKALFKELELNVAEYLVVNRADWIKDQNSELGRVERVFKFPIFVKPATGGSSIGAGKARDLEELEFKIEVAFAYSHKVIIESAFEDLIEVNCSVLGYGDEFRASVCEMPVGSEELLTFQDKYQKGGKGSKGSGMASLSRVIPAPINDKLTKEIQEISIKVFKALDGCGVARIDYFVSTGEQKRPDGTHFIDKNKGKVWINEVNSPPGSLSFYLWEPSGVKFRDLLNKIINYGLKRAGDQQKTQYVFNSGLLSQMAESGGSKK